MTLDPRLQRLLAFLAAHKNKLSAGLMVFVLTIAGFALYELLKNLHPADILAALRRITPAQLLASVGLTILSYLILTGYDVLALRSIGKPQPYWRAALGSFSSYTFSHNFGFAPITGAAARWRAYRGTNLDAADIARIVVIAGVTFWLGIFLLLGVILALQPGALRIHHYELAYPAQAAIGVVILTTIALYLWLCHRRHVTGNSAPLNILGWTLPVPTLRQALIQFTLAALDISVAAAALLVLVPQAMLAHFPLFLAAYVVAIVVALITHAPGGLGVFEAVMLVALPQVDRATLVSALIAYRLIYYWAPLLLAMLLLALHELARAFSFAKASHRKTHPQSSES
ncbi:lysylphosphatidylglycerol synthase domain-containing protein [Sandaracinobacteroides saxicola]|uniref:UPF0104 family protein n=1 Tax=Sandaracinobacteroides saxicola TaxID=2759707 RepID=A0A7G5IFD7_9SPHN|nr:lysylphosphatidylglycerol synthase domain-containing protein [Sandaracinobacteroides saxicola]QMW22079.1 UPF0104 family protein [Sandaracinobacteroides saxicola]